jgi:hypothetical protein
VKTKALRWHDRQRSRRGVAGWNCRRVQARTGRVGTSRLSRRDRSIVGKGLPEPREERVSALRVQSLVGLPKCAGRARASGPRMVWDKGGISPSRNAQDHDHRRQPSAVESCARRMMRALWACVLIAPFAVSQCHCVADPSDGVGVKGELSAERTMLLFDLNTPQQEYRA